MPLLASGMVSGSGMAVVFNATEEYRMARAIQKGRFRPEKPKSFEERFQNFDLPTIHRGLGTEGMVALIGLKATGKSTTLQQVLWEADNPFYMKVSHDDAHRAIHNQLRKGIWTLPWFMDGFRMDWEKGHEDVVTEVFKMVLEQTQKPVRLGFDIVDEPKHGIDAPLFKKAVETSTKHDVQFLTNFDAKLFVKRVKYLCADRHVSSALFATSEGLQMLSVQEPRLRKMLGRELPLPKAKEYVKSMGVEGIPDEMLTCIPRTFETLRELAATPDKQVFCDKEMKKLVVAVKESNAEAFKDAKGLYHKALHGPIDIDDIRATMSGTATLAGEPKEVFIKHMVKTNIFTPRDDGLYELQFDCQHKAVKKVFDSGSCFTPTTYRPRTVD